MSSLNREEWSTLHLDHLIPVQKPCYFWVRNWMSPWIQLDTTVKEREMWLSSQFSVYWGSPPRRRLIPLYIRGRIYEMSSGVVMAYEFQRSSASAGTKGRKGLLKLLMFQDNVSDFVSDTCKMLWAASGNIDIFLLVSGVVSLLVVAVV
jgi:hypothetical protein